MLQASDLVLVQLVTLAACAVLVWERIRQLPEPWRGRVRSLYLVSALLFVLTALAGRIGLPALAGLLVLAGVIVGGLAVNWRRRKAGHSIQSKGQ